MFLISASPAYAETCWNWPVIFQQNSPAVPGDKIKTKILILPFRNQGPSEQDNWIGEGFRVLLSQYLEMAYKAAVVNIIPSRIVELETATLMKLGEELNADVIVTGHYRREGKTMQVSAKFVDVKKGEIQNRIQTTVELGSGKKLSALFALIAQTAEERFPQVRLSKNAIAQNYHEINSVEAFRFYVMGSLALERWSPHYLMQARDLFQEALKQDYNYTPAYLAQARALLGLGFIAKLEGQAYREFFQKARQQMGRAEALNKTFAEGPLKELQRYLDSDVHEVSATTSLSHRDTGRAVKEFRRAWDLLPGNVRVAKQLATLYHSQGNTKEAQKLEGWVTEATRCGE